MKEIRNKMNSGWGRVVTGLSVGSLLTSAMLPSLSAAGEAPEWKGKIAKSADPSSR